jgi:dTDP-4-dehydrorhamnose 3,5-epimerase
VQPKSVPKSEPFTLGEIVGVIVRDLRQYADSRGWLAELFRHDELDPEFYPVMAYTSSTNPGVTRGPHEHVDQADLFCFLGPSNFKLRMWDNRKESETFNNFTTLIVGEDNPKSVLIPAGVVHAYQNVGPVDGIVFNCPNRLYMGVGKKEPIDEIRHEDDPQTIYRMDE